MTGSPLLDTNIVIAVFDQEPRVVEALNQADDLLIPCIAVGELYWGAYKSTRTEENVARIENFIEGVAILPCDAETGRLYGLIKNQLRIKGRLIPENDIWIAALARQHGMTLITRDIHFQEVDNLSIEVW